MTLITASLSRLTNAGNATLNDSDAIQGGAPRTTPPSSCCSSKLMTWRCSATPPRWLRTENWLRSGASVWTAAILSEA
jgi:hypothetical protein